MQIKVRNGKGKKDRITMQPDKLKPLLKDQIRKVHNLHQQDLARGYGRTILPNALAKKYPDASTEINWQYLFPAKNQAERPQNRITASISHFSKEYSAGGKKSC